MSRDLDTLVADLRETLAGAQLPTPEGRASLARAVADSRQAVAAEAQVDPANRSTVAATWLEPALGAAPESLQPLARSLRGAAPSLHWHYAYPSRPDLSDPRAVIGFCELIGPRGPFRSHATRLGLTLIGPGTDYPAHAHPAEEIYLLVSGTARWTAGGDTTRPRAGDAIFHASGVPHAMSTDESPLLAIYGWTGDVLSPSVYTD